MSPTTCRTSFVVFLVIMALTMLTAQESHTDTSKANDRPAKLTIEQLGRIAQDQTGDGALRKAAIRELLLNRLPRLKTLGEAEAVLKYFGWLKSEDYHVIAATTGNPLFKELTPGFLPLSLRIQLANDKSVSLYFIAIDGMEYVMDDDLKEIFHGRCPERLKSVRVLAVDHAEFGKK